MPLNTRGNEVPRDDKTGSDSDFPNEIADNASRSL